MAASILLNKQKDSNKEITDCGICSKTVDDPRMLDCFHTFCLKCLKSFGTGKSAGDNISCPVCKREFKIPSGGFDDVPVNDFVRKLVRIDKYPDQGELGVDLGKRFCDECLIFDQKEPAAEYCVDCSEHMCNTCIRKHIKNKFFVAHKTFGLDKKPRGDELLKMTANNCQDHPSNPIEVYCSDCKKTLCATCMHTGGHKEHNCMDIKKTAVELSKTTYVDAAERSRSMQETGEIIKLCDSTLEDLDRQIESVRSGVKKRYEEIKVLLEENYKELNETLDQIKGKRKGELEKMRDEGKQEMLMLESLERHWNEVKARGSDCDVVQAAISLQKRREEVVKQHEEQMRAARENSIFKNSHRIKFETDSFTIGSGKSLLGAIRPNETSTEHMPSDDFCIDFSPHAPALLMFSTYRASKIKKSVEPRGSCSSMIHDEHSHKLLMCDVTNFSIKKYDLVENQLLKDEEVQLRDRISNPLCLSLVRSLGRIIIGCGTAKGIHVYGSDLQFVNTFKETNEWPIDCIITDESSTDPVIYTSSTNDGKIAKWDYKTESMVAKVNVKRPGSMFVKRYELYVLCVGTANCISIHNKDSLEQCNNIELPGFQLTGGFRLDNCGNILITASDDGLNLLLVYSIQSEDVVNEICLDLDEDCFVLDMMCLDDCIFMLIQEPGPEFFLKKITFE